jgi:hypothetical protein
MEVGQGRTPHPDVVRTGRQLHRLADWPLNQRVVERVLKRCTDQDD